MNLAKILIKTGVVRSGMSFGDALQECVDKDVPGIPYVDAEGRIAGRFSVRHAFRECCVPRDLILGGHLLGDDIDHMNLPEVHAEEVLSAPVENYLLEDAIRLHCDSHAVRALALMEQFNTGYLFVTDADDNYRGVITRMGIAKLLTSRECSDI